MPHAPRLAALALGLAATGAHAALCTLDAVPAATLLFPYVEIPACDALAASARVTFANVGAAPRLVRFALHSDVGVPLYDADVYLQGYAQESIDLRALVCVGTQPSSGVALSQPGRGAEPEVNFAGCNATTDPANGAPVYAPLDATRRAALDAALTGSPDPVTGTCAALPRPRRANGTFVTTARATYATLDVVDRCDAPGEGEPGHAAALVDANVLTGHVQYRSGFSDPYVQYDAIALEADRVALANSVTFYGPDGGGGDGREPLPSTWAHDLQFGGADARATDELVFRKVAPPATPFACAALPTHYPIVSASIDGFDSATAFEVKDGGLAYSFPWRGWAPRVTQRVAMEPYLRGDGDIATWFHANLGTAARVNGLTRGQAWLGRLYRAEGRYSVVHGAAPLDASCTGPAFDNEVQP